MTDKFAAIGAKKARQSRMLPLLIGLSGPSGSGKTYSALRLARGIQSVVGGEIFMIDTEQGRSLHYADEFDFQYVEFKAPYGSLRFLEALRFARKEGAGVAVIDSCSHEHNGPGGFLEQWEQEIERRSGGDAAKAERVKMLAIQKPVAARKELIAAITTELDIPVIFCFRARETAKPGTGEMRGKIVEMGFTPIGSDDWVYEMAVSALLLPASNGAPTWRTDKPGERAAIKLPGHFRWLAKDGHVLCEEDGARLARWAKGEAVAPAAENESFEARPARAAAGMDKPDAKSPLEKWLDKTVDMLNNMSVKEATKWRLDPDNANKIEKLRTGTPPQQKVYDMLMEVLVEKTGEPAF